MAFEICVNGKCEEPLHPDAPRLDGSSKPYSSIKECEKALEEYQAKWGTGRNGITYVYHCEE
jgi:hypothetical protein